MDNVLKNETEAIDRQLRFIMYKQKNQNMDDNISNLINKDS